MFRRNQTPRPELPRFEDPSEVVGLETAFECERRGHLNSAVAGYTNMIKAYGELQREDRAVKIDGLICLFGLLRCAAQIPSGREQIPGYQKVANMWGADILADEDLSESFRYAADKLVSPHIQDMFGEARRSELRELCLEAFADPDTRFSLDLLAIQAATADSQNRRDREFNDNLQLFLGSVISRREF